MPSAPKLDAPQGQPLFEVQFRAISESLAGNGVLSNGDLEVTDGTNALEIDVAAGTLYYVATEYAYGGASPAATLSGGDGTYDRWDTVAFDTGTSSVVVHEGTPEQYPTPPDISGGEVLLAIVFVASGATDIAPSDILNWRAKFSNEAEEVHYDDSTGDYAVDNVDAALDAIDLNFVRGRDNTITGLLGHLGTNPGTFSSIVDATVDSNSGVGTAHSYTFSLDATDLIQCYAESDGAGGIQNARVNLPVLARLGGDLHTTGGTVVYDSTAGWVPRPQVSDHKVTNTVTAAYTTSDEEVIFADPSGTGGLTITLASADNVDGNQIIVVDISGTADANPITVDTGGTETIDGASSVTIDTPYAGRTFVSSGSDWSTPGAGGSTEAIETRKLEIPTGASEHIPAGEADHLLLDDDDTSHAFTVNGSLDVDGAFVVEGA